MNSKNEQSKSDNEQDFVHKAHSIALLTDQASQFLAKSIQKQGEENSIKFHVWEAPIDQIESQIFNPKSKFNSKNFDSIIVFESSHALLRRYNISNEVVDFAEENFNRIQKIINRLLERKKSKIILFNYYEINDKVYGNFSSKFKESFIYNLRKLNFLISEFCLEINSLSILDISSIQNIIGSENMYTPSLYVNYDIVVNLDSLKNISESIVDIIFSNNSFFNKCIIIDLDNTIWGGVIGDDGIENISLGNLGIGKSFVELQYWIKKLKDRGIIVCVCSKNNENVAKSVFIHHPEMILKLEDISLFVANWDSKVDNIKRIQKILNINFDSMVFIDDNPYERNVVKTNLPLVTVPELPEDPSDYLDFLYKKNYFEINTISELDRDRTKLYQTEFKREKSKKTYTDLTSYMSSLEMESKIEFLNAFNIPRVSQLSKRSNQFNDRTVRYTEKDLKDIMASAKYFGLVFDLKDKFGSYGIISFMILKEIHPNEVFIENWAMSCRVLERGMEQLIINYLVPFCKSRNYDFINSEYIRTEKNSLIEDLYPSLGFNASKFKFRLNIKKYTSLDTKIILLDEKR